MQRYTVYLYLETALHVSGGTCTHHQGAYTCIYSIWYLSHRYCYLPLSWKSWNRFECAVGGVRVLLCEMIGFSVRIVQNMNTHIEKTTKFMNIAISVTGCYRAALNG
jgi:hypothetical protein